ncbi:phosphotransferase enzyme family protein [Paenibacillus mendelii]|uniref:Phosphotransferase enzyme family protein n=1 Tax=Paenibacillus mendelii TaxID=206163 RepID=A0ABV6JES1_9BACL|nr:phosphotransferase [Paenibacillus mendelii]MCQ6557283.1 phosphotransferase [Paenibacillus mendelii]
MEKSIIEIFNDRLVELAAAQYGVNMKELNYIGGFQNFVYEYQLQGKSYILRFTPSSHRTVNIVQAELDWILYLARNGMSVSIPICSLNGVMTEVIEASGMYFTVVSFEKAEGRKISYPECLEDVVLYEKLGRMTGKIHALSKLYQPEDASVRRQEWTDNYYLQNIDFLPDSQLRIKERYLQLVNEINNLSHKEDDYGLIHGDMGVGNFFINEQGDITLFDFDEAQYSWFVEDIAIQLYYLVYVYGDEDGRALREEQAQRFMKPFMEGYRSENTLDDDWLKQLPLFLQLRELIVYIGAHRNYDGDESFSHSDNQWFKDWIAESRNRLENGIPIVNIWS